MSWIKAPIAKRSVLHQLPNGTKLEVMGTELLDVCRCTPSAFSSCIPTGPMQSDRGRRWWCVQMYRPTVLHNDAPWRNINYTRLSHWQADKASSADKGSNSEITVRETSQAKVSCPQAQSAMCLPFKFSLYLYLFVPIDDRI